MKEPVPIILNQTQRIDLASITKHPGMDVLMEVIAKGHCQQQLAMIYDVAPDDPERTTKLDGIGAVAYAMERFRDLLTREIGRNWKILQEQEEMRRAKGAGQ